MSKATDDEILAWARAMGGIVVTLDADFHTILAVSGASGPSVIRLRVQGLGAREIVQLMENVLDRFESELKKGALISVKAHKISCHHLPIGGFDSGVGTD